MVLMDAWDPAAAARLIEQFGVEQTSGTPFHLAGLMEAAARDGRDLSSLKQFLIGATTVPPSVVAATVPPSPTAMPLAPSLANATL